MEFLVGLYLVGYVMCSLFIVAVVKQRPKDFKDYTWYQLIGVGVFTCFVWPAFLIWTILRKFKK